MVSRSSCTNQLASSAVLVIVASSGLFFLGGRAGNLARAATGRRDGMILHLLGWARFASVRFSSIVEAPLFKRILVLQAQIHQAVSSIRHAILHCQIAVLRSLFANRGTSIGFPAKPMQQANAQTKVAQPNEDIHAILISPFRIHGRVKPRYFYGKAALLEAVTSRSFACYAWLPGKQI